MIVVALVGPPHAGKSRLVREIRRDPTAVGPQSPLEILDLDESLGPSHRSDEKRAIETIQSLLVRCSGLCIVDVGAG